MTDSKSEVPANPRHGGSDDGVLAGEQGLRDDLDRLLTHANGDTITLRRVMAVLDERAHAVLILLVASPFLVIPIPGISTLIGLLLAVLSLGIAFNMKPWLPGFIADRELSNNALSTCVHGADRVLSRAEKWVHPRMGFMLHDRMHGLLGLSLFMLCIALALPIPIPGNNVPPAIGNPCEINREREACIRISVN